MLIIAAGLYYDFGPRNNNNNNKHRQASSSSVAPAAAEEPKLTNDSPERAVMIARAADHYSRGVLAFQRNVQEAARLFREVGM